MTPMFIGHGSPMNAIEENAFTRSLQAWAQQNLKPTLILAVSAHWVTAQVSASVAEKNTTLHDFGGFPAELFHVQYQPAGAPELLPILSEILGTEIFSESNRGLDHGVWSVLKHMYPLADVSVVQLSLEAGLTFQQHFDRGALLANLSQKISQSNSEIPQRILLLVSGNLAHNLSDVRWNSDEPVPWAVEFDGIIQKAIEEKNWEALIHPEKYNDLLWQAHPTLEHYVPLLYAAGTASVGNMKHQWIYEGIEMGTLSMRSVVWN